MARTPWGFLDPVTLDTYYMPVNPNEDLGSHSVRRNTLYTAQVALRRTITNEDRVDTLMYQQGFVQETFSYSGNVYNLQDFNDLTEWCGKDYPILMTDDLGRTFSVYITSLQTSRKRSRHFRYKHGYTFSGYTIAEVF
jgi:hypothetical protein